MLKSNFLYLYFTVKDRMLVGDFVATNIHTIAYTHDHTHVHTY